MKQLLAQLWADDTGAVQSFELTLISGVLIVGTGSGLAALRDSVNRSYQTIGLRLEAAVSAPQIPPPPQMMQHYTAQVVTPLTVVAPAP